MSFRSTAKFYPADLFGGGTTTTTTTTKGAATMKTEKKTEIKTAAKPAKVEPQKTAATKLEPVKTSPAKELPKAKPEPVKTSKAKPAADGVYIAETAETADGAKPVDPPKPAPISWAAFKTAAADRLAKAAKLHHQPGRGLVAVNLLGVYVAAEDVRAFRAVQRQVSADRAEFFRTRPADVFRDEIAAAAKDEATALTATGINYHDDRGDGLLYVQAFRNGRLLSAWLTACAAAGISSRVRAC